MYSIHVVSNRQSHQLRCDPAWQMLRVVTGLRRVSVTIPYNICFIGHPPVRRCALWEGCSQGLNPSLLLENGVVGAEMADGRSGGSCTVTSGM